MWGKEIPVTLTVPEISSKNKTCRNIYASMLGQLKDCEKVGGL